jgi:hypothetical protein
MVLWALLAACWLGGGGKSESADGVVANATAPRLASIY